jgi:MFS family permease
MVILVCAVSLTAHWAFMFWHQVHLRNLPDVLRLSDGERNHLANKALYLVIVASIAGNFFAAMVARLIGYRRAIAFLCFGYFVAMIGTYWTARDHIDLLYWLMAPGFFQGVFALFTMYLPPLFPTLLRTTGAGFCYNIGRIAAGLGTIFFGLFSYRSILEKGAVSLDYRITLFYAGFLFLPAAVIAWFLPELRDEPAPAANSEPIANIK